MIPRWINSTFWIPESRTAQGKWAVVQGEVEAWRRQKDPAVGRYSGQARALGDQDVGGMRSEDRSDLAIFASISFVNRAARFP
jgi:hypothetical protein